MPIAADLCGGVLGRYYSEPGRPRMDMFLALYGHVPENVNRSERHCNKWENATNNGSEVPEPVL